MTSQNDAKMAWTDDHNIIFMREVLMYEPWNHQKGKPERGQIWKNIAESLNSIDHPYFKVTDRSVRDNYNVLEKAYNKQESVRNKGSGLEVDEENELDQAMRDGSEQFRDSELKREENKLEKNKALQDEALAADEVRKVSLERFGETRKRKEENDEGESPKSSKRVRNTGSETYSYLQVKHKDEVEFRNKQLELQKEEQKLQREQQKMQIELQREQQQQMAAFIQQQQQVNLALINMLSNKKD
ncbi:probable cyclin-dependent serine/threonine-protein kinase DDB_G0278487 [Clytia hemisphaerica]|uniref:Uncharacterized protein n=1 Tax=Clytia hemisphaerica TaxID=252671 RepID=A0A7M5XNL7_9CNID